MMDKYWKKNKKIIKGQFVVYTKEGKRFVVPLCYLHHPIFKVLLEMAEEEYGLTIHGPLIVPCENELMEYILGLLKKKPAASYYDSEYVERAFLSSSVTTSPGTAAGASLSATLFLPTMMAAAASSGHAMLSLS